MFEYFCKEKVTGCPRSDHRGKHGVVPPRKARAVDGLEALLRITLERAGQVAMSIKMRADLIQNVIMYPRRFHQNFMLARIDYDQSAVGPSRHAVFDSRYIHNLFIAAKKAKTGLWGAGHM